MSLLGKTLEDRNISQREFQRRTEEMANKHPELKKRGVSQGAISNFVNDKVDTDISTMHLIAMTMASIDTSKSTGEWLYLLILEAGYPLANVKPEDIKVLITESVTVDPIIASELRRVHKDLGEIIHRMGSAPRSDMDRP